ncbi:MAG TPA: hypothetical protein VFX45_08950 [Solirubrobacterales bacterium]|nr:hypothetical protein [Solirubrobacterales bacterium]
MPSWRSAAVAPVRSRQGQGAALVLLGLALLAAAAVLLDYGSGLTWFQDSWEFLMNRRDPTAAALFDPHNEHIVLIPVLIQEALLRVFGMDSMTPELVVLVVLHLATAALLFVYVRRRLGPWPALMAAVLLLFLGPAWQDLLWPFQVGFVGSATCGVGVLLALESERRRADLLAAALLVVSVGFSSLGLAFAVGAAVDVLQRRRERGLGRLWVVAAPLLFYAAWYAGWGHDAENNLSAHNVLVSPRFVAEGLAASLDAVLALATIFDEAVGRSDWAVVLLVALAGLLAYAVFRGRRFSPRLWPAVAAAAAFWLLAAFNSIPGREAWSSRYLYVGGLFLLLIAANLLQGMRLKPWALVAGGSATVAIAVLNLTPLREGRDFFAAQTVLTRSDLGAIEIAAGSVEPEFALPSEIAGTSFLNEIEAGEYLQAVDEYGSPAYSPADLAGAPEVGRRQADIVLANALPLEIETGAEAATPGADCVRVRGNGGAPLPLRPGTTTVALPPGGLGAIRLRRFARAGYPLSTEGVAAPSTTRLYVPRDLATRPWRLLVEASQGATVCWRAGQ